MYGTPSLGQAAICVDTASLTLGQRANNPCPHRGHFLGQGQGPEDTVSSISDRDKCQRESGAMEGAEKGCCCSQGVQRAEDLKEVGTEGPMPVRGDSRCKGPESGESWARRTARGTHGAGVEPGGEAKEASA